ncbi:MAG TPA: DUF1800 domain-containing protein [Ktedonobacteraceae bacterium]|nr:DUF1800 domain-containing protein [Ktedonobacteraceae bacterium]
MSEEMFDQPTEPGMHFDQSQDDDLSMEPQATQASVSRRKFMSKSAVGLAALGGAGVAAALAGVALEHSAQPGGSHQSQQPPDHQQGVVLKHSTPPNWWTNPFQRPGGSRTQIGHLLRRAGFGASPEEIAIYESLGFSRSVDRLLNFRQVVDDDMENRLKAVNLDLNSPTAQQHWWLMRMAWTQRPLLEKMTLFWHGVLTSSYRNVDLYTRMINQNQFLREHAFDTLDNILLGITIDPAMLLYLNLAESTKEAPNENYARELMELFTLGLGHYTQRDVYEAASALTGWRVEGLTSYYSPQDHNNQIKTYLGHTGNLDYKDVINILVNHPATPWFICRKLFTFFVYENPSTDDLKPLVDTYVQSGHNMGAVMRTLLLSPQFSSAKAYRSRVKSPVEFAVGAYRELSINGDGSGLAALIDWMGQTLFDPPNVAGWPGDKVSALWLNSGTWMNRLYYVDMLLYHGINTLTSVIDLQGMVNKYQLSSPEQFVDHFSSFLLDGNIDSDRRAQLIDYFTSQDRGGGGAPITLSDGKSYPLGRVRGTLYLILASPEYQLN